MTTHSRSNSLTTYVGLLVTIVLLTACDSTSSSTKPETTPGGMVIEELTVGDGAQADAKSAVAVHYTGWLYDETQTNNRGKEFDSSISRNKPFEFVLGMRSVIRGWDEGVVGMKVGGKRRLTIPSALAYGTRGAGRDIPPNATLIFDIELLATDAVTIRDQVIGDGDEATLGAEVSVDYTGWLYDADALNNKGKKFDSSIDRGNKFEFMIGRRQVITGWEVGVQGMKVGGKRTLIIPPSMAYGATGSGDAIPPNSTLVFDIELFEVTGGAL